MAKAVKKAPAGVKKPVKKIATKKVATIRSARGIITPKMITNGPLEWYDVTEQTKFVLNNRLAGYLKSRVAEQRNINPDPRKIATLTKSINEIIQVSDSPRTFQSLASMKKILAKYAPHPAGNNR